MSKKQEILKDASVYTSATMLTQLITLVAGIMSRHFLGPVQMGVWSLLQIILVYSAYSPLGVTEAISREIPYHLGRKDVEKAEEVKNLAFSFSTFTSSLIAVGVVIYAFIMRSKIQQEMFYGLLSISLVVVLQRLSNLYVSFLRGFKHFSLAASQMIISAIVNAVLVALFTYKFKIYGFIWAMFFSFVFNIAYIHYYQPFHFKWKWDTKEIIKLIRFGFPLVVIAMMSTFFFTMDKILIAKFVGLRGLGLFSIAMLAFTYIGYFPNSIGIVLIPNFHEKYGVRQEGGDLRNYVQKSTHIFAESMPVLIATGWFLLPFFVRLVLREYVEGITAMRYMILSYYFLSLWQPYSYFVTVIRKQIMLVPIISSVFLIALLVNLLAIKRGMGIDGVSIVTVFATGLQYLFTYLYAAPRLYGAGEKWKILATDLFKFVFMMTAFLLLGRLFPDAEKSLWQSVLQFVIFTAFYIPAYFKLNAEFGIFEIFKKKVLAFFPKPSQAGAHS